jgi:hypothetical protein
LGLHEVLLPIGFAIMRLSGRPLLLLLLLLLQARTQMYMCCHACHARRGRRVSKRSSG